MSRSLKSKRRSSKRKSRNERGGTCMKAQSCWSRKRKRSACEFLLISADFKHLVQSNPTKRCSCRFARIYPIASLVYGGADQSSAILCSFEKQKQGHSSSLYRRLLWLKPYPVRFHHH